MLAADRLDPRIDYPNFPEFERCGIDLGLVRAELILTLQHLRTCSGIPLTPSPVSGAWGRLEGSATSRHWAVGRLSDAGDIFPAKGRTLDCWLAAQGMGDIGGIGLYVDTRGPDGTPWPMMHIDLRPGRLLWTSERRDAQRVYYYHTYPDGHTYQAAQGPDFWRVVDRIIRGEWMAPRQG